jgi:hypothetical protein
MYHIVEALNDIEMFDCLGGNDGQSGPDDELIEDRLFGFKAILIWTINDWSVKMNVQC